MNTHIKSLLAALALAVSPFVSSTALAAGYERGPAPTASALNAMGPYQLGTYKIAAADAKAYDFGGATVYYPKAQGETFGVVTMMPGFLAFQAVYTGLVQKIASHGFIVINIDSVARGDVPDVRAKAVAGALKLVAELADSGKAPYAAVADTSRRGVVGNSMGGGAVLTAAQADPTLKALVALQPWHTTKTFPTMKVPSLIVACQTDNIAPNKQHSDLFYASFPKDLLRGEIEMRGVGHLCATFLASKRELNTMGKSTVAWLKRFVDDDMRYDALVKGGINENEFSRFVIEGF